MKKFNFHNVITYINPSGVRCQHSHFSINSVSRFAAKKVLKRVGIEFTSVDRVQAFTNDGNFIEATETTTKMNQIERLKQENERLLEEIKRLREDNRKVNEDFQKVVVQRDEMWDKVDAIQKKCDDLSSRLEKAQSVIDGTREDLHQRRIADWYPEGEHYAAARMSEDMRLIGNSLAAVDLGIPTESDPSDIEEDPIHNPDHVTEWGADEGYRLLFESEVILGYYPIPLAEIELLHSNGEWESESHGNYQGYTYRTKLTPEQLAKARKGAK